MQKEKQFECTFRNIVYRTNCIWANTKDLSELTMPDFVRYILLKITWLYNRRTYFMYMQ